MNPQQTIKDVTIALRPAAFTADEPPGFTYNNATFLKKIARPRVQSILGRFYIHKYNNSEIMSNSVQLHDFIRQRNWLSKFISNSLFLTKNCFVDDIRPTIN